MKLNIFQIPLDRVAELRDKFNAPSLGMKILSSEKIGLYKTDFYFSQNAKTSPIPWVETFSLFFNDPKPANTSYFACYLWISETHCFAISYGKCHFYLRDFCNNDFGTHIAKRIANEKDIRQKSSKKFAGKKKKEIKSYAKNTRLDIESGESVDYLNSSIIPDLRPKFGKTGKFGASVLLSLDIAPAELPHFFDTLIETIDLPENFPLPRTIILDKTARSRKLEQELISAILSDSDDTDFTENSHELFGVDFVFSGHEKYKLSHRGRDEVLSGDLSLKDLRDFVKKYSIPRDEIMAISVLVEREGSKPYRTFVRDSLDYIVDGENIILSQGKWMEFNEDYIAQLDDYVDEVDIEPTEKNLQEVDNIGEAALNQTLETQGYKNADKDFSKIKTSAGIPVEAWDLQKDGIVYALKIGKPQKLGYVCDQALNTLELIKKKGNIKKLNTDFKVYCLWLVLNRTNRITKISEIKSIILKQKIESWARKALEFGIIPKIKISYLKQ